MLRGPSGKDSVSMMCLFITSNSERSDRAALLAHSILHISNRYQVTCKGILSRSVSSRYLFTRTDSDELVLHRLVLDLSHLYSAVFLLALQFAKLKANGHTQLPDAIDESR